MPRKNFTQIKVILCVAFVAAAFTLTSFLPNKDVADMSKKEIMDAFLAGTLDENYVPAAFFIHFPGNAKVGEGAVKSHLEFFRNTNADILKVQFEQSPARIQDLDKQETWDNIGPLPEDFYRPTFDVIKALKDSVGDKVYILPTIYSPYQVARQSLLEGNIAKAAVERRQDLIRVLGYYATALEWLIDACKSIGIEGFYMTTQGGEMKFNNIPGFYDEIIKPMDMRIMSRCIEGTKLNILHICDWEGTYDDLSRFKDYPGQIVNTPINLNGTSFSTRDGEVLFGRPVLGGIERQKEIIHDTPAAVAQRVREAINNGPKGRMMLGAECTVSSAPLENIQTAISVAHGK